GSWTGFGRFAESERFDAIERIAKNGPQFWSPSWHRSKKRFRRQKYSNSPCRKRGAFIQSPPLARRPLENLQARRDDRPGRAARGEDGHGRAEGGRVVQRACIQRVRVGLADLAAEHQAHAFGATISHRLPAMRRLRAELARFAGE